MAWRPNPYFLEGELDNTVPGKVTGWMRFVGLASTVTFDLAGNFHRDIRGARLHVRGDSDSENPDAAEYMQGFAAHQTGDVGDITAGREPRDYVDHPYIEWYGVANGRVVLVFNSEQVEVIGRPIPACESDPISREAQQANMARFLSGMSAELNVPAIVASPDLLMGDPSFTHRVVDDDQIVGEARSVEPESEGVSRAFVHLFARVMPGMARSRTTIYGPRTRPASTASDSFPAQKTRASYTTPRLIPASLPPHRQEFTPCTHVPRADRRSGASATVMISFSLLTRGCIMKVLWINNDGGGFADYVEIDPGTTVAKFFSERLSGRQPEDDLIRVNRQPVSRDHVIQENDRVTMTPVKIEGARAAQFRPSRHLGGIRGHAPRVPPFLGRTAMESYTLLLGRWAVRIHSLYQRQAERRLEAVDHRLGRAGSALDSVTRVRRRLATCRYHAWRGSAKAQLEDLRYSVRDPSVTVDPDPVSAGEPVTTRYEPSGGPLAGPVRTFRLDRIVVVRGRKSHGHCEGTPSPIQGAAQGEDRRTAGLRHSRMA